MDDPRKVSLSCIIPAFNEADRIGKVLDVVVGHEYVSEVIVVDDGSTDGTSRAAVRPGVEVVAMPSNVGKSAAVCAGAALASGTHVMLLDADLGGISRQHLSQLAKPVLDGAADATLSLRANSPWLWRLIGIDYLSGERVFPAALLRDALEGIRALPGFGLEVYLNQQWLDLALRVKVVHWDAVSNPTKSAKYGRWTGIGRDYAMMRDIFRVVSLKDATKQVYRLRARSVG